MSSNQCSWVLGLWLQTAEHVVRGVAYLQIDRMLQPVIGWSMLAAGSVATEHERWAPTLNAVGCDRAYMQSRVICIANFSRLLQDHHVPSSVVWRLSCYLEPMTFFLTFLTIRWPLMLNSSGFAFAVICFFFAITVFLFYALSSYTFMSLSTAVYSLYGRYTNFDWLIDWLVDWSADNRRIASSFQFCLFNFE